MNRGWGGQRGRVEGVNSSMIPCKNLCKCHSVPSHSTTIKEKEIAIHGNSL
jgi:hypothetical protein